MNDPIDNLCILLSDPMFDWDAIQNQEQLIHAVDRAVFEVREMVCDLRRELQDYREDLAIQAIHKERDRLFPTIKRFTERLRIAAQDVPVEGCYFAPHEAEESIDSIEDYCYDCLSAKLKQLGYEDAEPVYCREESSSLEWCEECGVLLNVCLDWESAEQEICYWEPDANWNFNWKLLTPYECAELLMLYDGISPHISRFSYARALKDVEQLRRQAEIASRFLTPEQIPLSWIWFRLSAIHHKLAVAGGFFQMYRSGFFSAVGDNLAAGLGRKQLFRRGDRITDGTREAVVQEVYYVSRQRYLKIGLTTGEVWHMEQEKLSQDNWRQINADCSERKTLAG